ncbi:phage tail protein, partial [Actinosynnema sp.]|uniref:phage tail protein n=1 Tax=Actinosynnema sp. TaxID=1872144 RepID=UPI003F840D05
DMALGLITGDWQRAWSGLRDFLGGTWDLIVATTKLLVVDLMTMLADLPRAIFDLFADVGGLLFEAGKNLIKGLLKGIEHGWGWVKDKLGDLTDMLPEWKGPPARDRNLLRGNGNLLMRGLAEGLADGEPQVRRYLADLTDSLPAMIATVEPTASARATTTGAAVRGEDLAAFTDAVRRLAERPVIVRVGAVEIARATAEGNRSLARR